MGPGPLPVAVPHALRLSLRPLESHASEQARRVLFRVELIYKRCGPHATSEGQQARVPVATSCARCQSKTNARKVYTTEDRESHPSLTTPTRTCLLRAAHRPCGIESQGSDCESYDGIRARLAHCESRVVRPTGLLLLCRGVLFPVAASKRRRFPSLRLALHW